VVPPKVRGTLAGIASAVRNISVARTFQSAAHRLENLFYQYSIRAPVVTVALRRIIRMQLHPSSPRHPRLFSRVSRPRLTPCAGRCAVPFGTLPRVSIPIRCKDRMRLLQTVHAGRAAVNLYGQRMILPRAMPGEGAALQRPSPFPVSGAGRHRDARRLPGSSLSPFPRRRRGSRG
jgi:hypothetical protein